MEKSFEGGGGAEEGEISIAWRNLRYSVKQLSGWKFEKKEILRGLTGAFRTGTLNGLLGPSGGKQAPIF